MSAPKIGYFCINLASRPDRREVLEEQAAKIGIDIVFIEAVLGKELDLEKVEQYDRATRLRRYHGDLSHGQVGCALSHQKGIQAIADSDFDFGVLLEDDSILYDGFVEFLNAAVVESTGWDAIQLHNHFEIEGPHRFPDEYHRKLVKKLVETGGRHIIFPTQLSMNANSILYTREAAEKFARWFDRFDRAADYHIRECHMAGLVLAEIQPGLTWQSDAESDNLFLAEHEKPRNMVSYVVRRLHIRLRRFLLFLRSPSIIRSQ